MASRAAEIAAGPLFRRPENLARDVAAPSLRQWAWPKWLILRRSRGIRRCQHTHAGAQIAAREAFADEDPGGKPITRDFGRDPPISRRAG